MNCTLGNFCIISLVVLFVHVIPIMTYAQDSSDSTNIELENVERLGLSMGILGVSPVMGPTLDYLIAKKTSIEIGFGVPGPGFGIGLKIHPKGIAPDQRNIHIGLEGGAVSDIGFVYLPVGISYYQVNGEYLSFDIGPAIFGEGYAPYVNFKVGMKF